MKLFIREDTQEVVEFINQLKPYKFILTLYLHFTSNENDRSTSLSWYFLHHFETTVFVLFVCLGIKVQEQEHIKGDFILYAIENKNRKRYQD